MKSLEKQISSLHNPDLKKAIKLQQRKERNESGLFLIEGYRELTRAAHAVVVIKTLFICPDFFLGTQEKELIATIQATGAQIITCHPKAFEKLSYRDRPDGLVGIAEQMQTPFAALISKLACKKNQDI